MQQTSRWRLRVPNGILDTKQFRALAEVTSPYDNGSRDLWEPTGCADVTTRMNIQLRGMRLENLPDHWRKLRAAGVFSVQSGMDNVRNLVGNPLAGIDSEELVDTRKYCQEFTDMLTNCGEGNPEYTNLPRKFNVCYVGSKEMFEHPHINDIAYIPAWGTGQNGQKVMGWNIEVGGLLTGGLCEFAVPLNAWVPLDHHLHLGHAILTTFRDLGYRYNPRAKCRLMYLINDMGIHAFRAEVSRRYADRVTASSTSASASAAAAGTAVLAPAGESLVPAEWKRRELIGAHPQPGGTHHWIGIRVPAGRLFADEMLALADIADQYGTGELRLTVEENILIPGVAAGANLDACLAALAARVPRCPVAPGTLAKGTVSCTGNQFCGFANINTKGNAVKFAEVLDAKLSLPKDVRIHWTGCPNTCGQIQLGDIGLLGVPKGKDSKGNKCEAVDVYLGGGIGQTAAIGTLYREAVPIDESLESVLTEILVEKFGAVPRAAAGAAAGAAGVPAAGVKAGVPPPPPAGGGKSVSAPASQSAPAAEGR